MLGETPRAAVRVLSVVSELHARGYQELRISPGMSGSGMYWRVAVAPARWIDPRTMLLTAEDVPAARYTTGQEKRYFDWTDAESATVTRLADLFSERFPRILAESRGRDWSYAGWYLEMLGHARRGHFPVAYADWYSPPPPDELSMTSVEGARGDSPSAFPRPPAPTS